MEKNKIVLLKRSEIAVLRGNSKEFVVAEIDNENLNFSIYKKSSEEAVVYRLAVAINNKKLNTYEFEDEIYLRAKSDTEAIAPFCITEYGNTLNLLNLNETDCTSIVDDMMGSEKDIAENFEILEGQPYLIEDEFSV